VTIEPLREAGVRYFAWLQPGETMCGPDGVPFPRQPQVPHGGFVYLFHELSAVAAQDMAPDCYFALASVTEHTPNGSESFALVGEERPSELMGHAQAQLHSHDICLLDAAYYS